MIKLILIFAASAQAIDLNVIESFLPSMMNDNDNDYEE